MDDSAGSDSKVIVCERLNFGLWKEGSETASLTDAQRQMLSRLLALFPSSPFRILYVGCSASFDLLSELCNSIEAKKSSEASDTSLSLGDALQLIHSEIDGFLDTDEDQSYDVIVFLESAQRATSLDHLIKKTARLLKQNGTIVIADEVRRDQSLAAFDVPYSDIDFEILLSENNFKIIHNESVGRLVLPMRNFIPREEWRGRTEWYQSGLLDYRIISSKKDPYFLRAYSKHDEEQILPMFNSIFHAGRSMAHWHWKYRDNPYGKYNIALAISESGAFVAHYAGYPVPFYDASEFPKCFITIQSGDTMSSPAVRNVGIGRTGIMARTVFYYCAKFCRNVLPLVYGFNTGNVKKLGERYFNYRYIDQVSFWTRDLLQTPFQKPGLLNRVVAGYSVDAVTSVDTEWDVFFDSICDSYKMLVQRDARYVKWRYLDCPDRIHKVFSIRRRGRLVGWSVFSRTEDRIIWGDALFDRRYQDSVPVLLHRVIENFFPGSRTIEGWFSPNPAWWASILRNSGFEPTEEPNHLTPGFLIFEEESLLEKLGKFLYYTKGDSDLF
ncbi:MAG: hypothetical protein WA610_11100 [Thermodesulfovibrionales bacterium]